MQGIVKLACAQSRNKLARKLCHFAGHKDVVLHVELVWPFADQCLLNTMIVTIARYHL